MIVTARLNYSLIPASTNQPLRLTFSLQHCYSNGATAAWLGYLKQARRDGVFPGPATFGGPTSAQTY